MSERVRGVDSAGYEVAETDYGWRWGPITITRIASIEGRGVVVDLSTEAGSVEVHATPSGQSMTVEVRQTDLDDRKRRRLLHHWKMRGRRRGRPGWLAAFDDVTPEAQDQTDPETGDPR